MIISETSIHQLPEDYSEAATDYTERWSMLSIDERIEQLYRDMKPLHDYYGIKPKTIEERYEEYKQKQQIKTSIRKPKFKLPKL
jgi:hypothetical protein